MHKKHQIEIEQHKRDLTPEQLLHVIFDYTAKIANERNLDNLLMLMADMGKTMIVADRCTVWLIDQQTNELWTRVAHGIQEIRIPYGSGLVGYAIKHDQPVYINDAYTDEKYKEVLKEGALKTDQITGYHTKSHPCRSIS